MFLLILLLGPSGLRTTTRNELYAIAQRSDESTFDGKLQFMEQELLRNYSQDDPRIADVKQRLSIIKHQFKNG